MNLHADETLPRMRRATPAPALKPLVLAILAAFPVYAAAQATVPRPAAPPAFVVPRPMPGWRVSGTGAPAPLNAPNAAGGTDQTVNQSSQRAIYNWQSFDIGSRSSVTFNFPSAESSALNRVIGSPTPSQIFGSLKSQYTNPDPSKSPLVGGSVYLINANGILFGRDAQVNVGALIASTLNLKDSDYFSGLTNSITGTAPSFQFEGAPELFTDSRNFVLVDPGAKITTPDGGRVFLFAKNVQNGGTISTPGGQTALAGGAEVYLASPNGEPLYASEVNPNFPALRGLLVEVGKGSGTATNLAGGVIDTPRGNATLVGMAVNQAGRITATTSVSENGSVMLLARGGASADPTKNNVKHASVSGTLTLGVDSSVEIAPDHTPGSDGLARTSDGSSAFTTSRVELAGQSVELKSGAAIVAPGGIVNIRAEVAPNYDVRTVQSGNFKDSTKAARLILGGSTRIDVSGTDSTTVSVARNFVTTELLGKSDLKDAPLQKDGPLYRSKVTFDLRSAVPILGDTSSYQSAVKRTVDERLSAGGSISLASTGAVVTSQSSVLDVSGGKVTYTEATVTPTRLIAADGTRYTLNQAAPDLLYTGIEAASKAATQDRWGIVPQYLPTQAVSGRLELGYVAGAAGGSLSVYAPLAVLDGGIAAATTSGRRQTTGVDAQAAAGRIELGTRTSGGAFGSSGFLNAGLGDLSIGTLPQALPPAFWLAPLTGPLPTESRIAASTLNDSGAGKVTVTSNGRIVQQTGADIALGPGASLDLGAAGAGGIVLGGSFSAIGGSFAARAIDLPPTAAAGATVSGAIVLEAGRSIDVAGDWSNAFLDGADAAPARAGGSVTLAAAHGLLLRDSSRIDVSGGVNVRASGALVGTNAGSITLESNNVLAESGAVAAPVHLGAVLKGQSLAGGGSLRVKAADIAIGALPIPRGVADGQTPGSLRLSEAFFRNGGFTNYDIAAVRSLRLQSGTTLRPQASNWLATADARNVASGTRPNSVLEEGQLPDATRRPVSLSLTANAGFATAPFGDLTLAVGSSIVTDPLATVNLRAGLNLLVDGGVYAPGGNVNLALVSTTNILPRVQGSLRLGSTATIDVSGTAVLQPSDGSLARGKVLPGGKVGIDTASAGSTVATAIELRPGSVIAADGASGRLLVDTVTAGNATASRAQTVSSEGGSITIAASDGGTALAGSMHAFGGDASVAAGKFALTLTATARDPLVPLPTDIFDRVIQVQEAAITGGDALRGVAKVSASTLRAGFADVSLSAPDHITFNGSTELAMPRTLVLNTAALQALPGSRVSLSGGASLQVGGAPGGSATVPPASSGSASLALEGGLVELSGAQTLQGFSSLTVDATTELRLNATFSNGVASGSLNTLADLQLNAAQIAPTTASSFTINAPGKRVTIGPGDATAAPPLSAAGAITINAADIVQNGVLRAPFGAVNLNATRSMVLGATSVTSVSGDGLTVPYGSTVGDLAWSYANAAVKAPAEKTINLLAPGKQIDVKPGAVLDLSGGGDLLALEFVPGPGGSKDVFADAGSGAFAVIPSIKSYAPQDRDLQALAGNSAAVVPLGSQVTFGPGGPIPAGTYAVLPARYATLAGAYLVTPTATAAPFDLGAAVAKPDGSFVVGARLGFAGTSYTGAPPASFKVMGSTVARARSEIHETDADTYFTQQAAAAGTATARLPRDAGRLNIVADALSLKGSYDFGHPADALARGGELDISATRIRVGGTAPSEAGVLSLQAADLNATGASLLVLGAQRGGASGETLAVDATDIVVDTGAQALKVADLVLAATGRVELAAGARIESTGLAPSQALSVAGDGALLRVSGDGAASTQRSGVIGKTGDLVIGAGAALKAASITAEGTRSAALATDATLVASDSLTLGASRMAVGPVAAGAVPATTLQLTPSLLAQIGQTDALSLRSFGGIDFYGSSSLGSSTLRSLTLDTPALRMAQPGAVATVQAGGVGLSNTSGASVATTVGTGRLDISATGSAGGTGQIVIGPGSVAASGATRVALNAVNEIVVNGAAQFSASGDVALNSAALIATRAAAASLSAGGQVVIASNGSLPTATAGSGAHVVIGAQGIEQRGRIVLPSGELTLNANADNAVTGVAFGAGSLTDLSGRASVFDGVTVATPGGDLRVNARSGDVVLAAGSTVDVSAPATSGQAGSVTISASAGGVDLSGRLRATAAVAQGGGALTIDSDRPLDLGRLAATLQAERTAALGNFAQSLDLRNRRGDQFLPAGGPGLAAHQIALASDAGALTIAGTLDAGTAADPSITLAAGKTLTIAPGAQLSGHSNSASGAVVQLMSGTSGAGGEAPNGRIALLGGSIDVSAAATQGSDGSVLLRAQLNDAGDDVRIDGIATRISGARRVEAEAVRTYAATVVDADLIARVEADNDAFAGSDGANAASIRTRLANGNAALLDKLQLRAGVEIVSKGDLRVEGDGSGNGWNLTRFDDSGLPLPQPSGAPMNLTLRAAGTLNVAASLSDGFLPAGEFVPDSAYAAKQIVPAAVILPGDGASITLVGGADLRAANVTATVRGDASGDVAIGASGQDVLVRTTTGRVQVAAGRDVKLLNRSAVVYTTGAPVATDALTGYVGNQLAEPTINYLATGETIQNPFLQGGGSVSVAAGRDLLGPSGAQPQYASDWLWNSGDLGAKTGAPLWRTRYDLFKQGFATFGGGSIAATAGRDASGVEISAATSGYVARDADGALAETHVFGGGSASLIAQRDVVSGFVLAGKGEETVRAGRQLTSAPALGPLQVVYGETQTAIGARNAVQVGRVTAFGMVESAAQAFDTTPVAMTGLAQGASLRVQSDAGDLSYAASTPLYASGHVSAGAAQTVIIPAVATFAAPSGNVTIGRVVQVPSTDGSLALLAGGSLTTAAVTVTATKAAERSPSLLSGLPQITSLVDAFPAGSAELDTSSRDPVRLVALDGDLTYTGPMSVARPLRMIAGRDIVASALRDTRIQVQHQDAGELSLLQAGRDLLLPETTSLNADLKLQGPGNLVVAAGRDIDLRSSGGIGTLGNRELAQLPPGSATLTVLAGVRLDGSDFTQAARWYFPLLGGAGIAGYAPDLVAQLDAVKTGAALPGLGSSAAAAFKSLAVAERVAKAQTIAGTASFDAALLSFVRRHESKASLDLAAARTLFDGYAAADKQAVIAAALANAWATQVPKTQQLQQVNAMAALQDKDGKRTEALAAFVQTQTGRNGLTTAQALDAFAALPIERQLVFTGQVLTAEVRAAGRTASALTGSARDDAYAKAYAAIDTVFPELGTHGDLQMGSSQLRTFQGSGIQVFTPRGGINVGQLSAQSSTKNAGVLGIVTAAGGEIDLVVRDSVTVNQSRVFTVGKGDLLMWASEGNLDAGRGAKTVTGAPPPVFRFDANGNFVVDTSGSFTGSGIAVLDASSTLDLYAPKGEINAGDAGIKSLGNAFLGAARFVGADNLSVSGVAVGAPPPPPTGGDTAGLASLGQAATAAGTRINPDDNDEEKERKRRKRLNLILDFLGFGDGSTKP